MKHKSNHNIDSIFSKDKMVVLPKCFVKKARVIKAIRNKKETIFVSGNTISQGVQQFTFSVIQPQQQMQIRNNAYQFFSID